MCTGLGSVNLLFELTDKRRNCLNSCCFNIGFDEKNICIWVLHDTKWLFPSFCLGYFTYDSNSLLSLPLHNVYRQVLHLNEFKWYSIVAANQFLCQFSQYILRTTLQWVEKWFSVLALWHNCWGYMSLRTNWKLGLDLISRSRGKRRCFTCASFYGWVDNVCGRKSKRERG